MKRKTPEWSISSPEVTIAAAFETRSSMSRLSSANCRHRDGLCCRRASNGVLGSLDAVMSITMRSCL